METIEDYVEEISTTIKEEEETEVEEDGSPRKSESSDAVSDEKKNEPIAETEDSKAIEPEPTEKIKSDTLSNEGEIGDGIQGTQSPSKEKQAEEVTEKPESLAVISDKVEADNDDNKMEVIKEELDDELEEEDEEKAANASPSEKVEPKHALDEIDLTDETEGQKSANELPKGDAVDPESHSSSPELPKSVADDRNLKENDIAENNLKEDHVEDKNVKENGVNETNSKENVAEVKSAKDEKEEDPLQAIDSDSDIAREIQTEMVYYSFLE